MTTNEKHNLKRQEIVKAMLKYKDESGNIDTTMFRKEESNTYNLISYYFGSLDNALSAAASYNGEEVIAVVDSGTEVAKGAPVNRKTLRNELAYDMLVELKSKHTLEQIATRYGCSRMHVSQLFKSLENSIGADRSAEAEQQAE